MRNIFTGGDVADSFRDISYNVSLTVADDQQTYYVVKSGDTSWTPTTDSTPVNVSCGLPPSGADEELQFLDSLGLIVRDATGQLHVQEFAREFYKAGGLFVNPTKPDQSTVVNPLIALFGNHILPGRLFWLQTVGSLPDTIHPRTQQIQELLEMREFINLLRTL